MRPDVNPLFTQPLETADSDTAQWEKRDLHFGASVVGKRRDQTLPARPTAQVVGSPLPGRPLKTAFDLIADLRCGRLFPRLGG